MTTPLTDDELQQIREREQGATAGPWDRDYNETIGHIKSVAERLDGMTPTVAKYDIWHKYNEQDDRSDTMGHTLSQQVADGVFIAHSREDIPALLDEITLLREEQAAANAHCSMCGCRAHEAITQDGCMICEALGQRAELSRLRAANDHLEQEVRVMRAREIPQ